MTGGLNRNGERCRHMDRRLQAIEIVHSSCKCLIPRIEHIAVREKNFDEARGGDSDKSVRATLTDWRERRDSKREQESKRAISKQEKKKTCARNARQVRVGRGARVAAVCVEIAFVRESGKSRLRGKTDAGSKRIGGTKNVSVERERG